MLAHPADEIVLVAFARGDLFHHPDDLVLRSAQPQPIPAQEQDEREEGHALVPVDIAVVGSQALAVGGRQSGEVDALLVGGPFLARTSQS